MIEFEAQDRAPTVTMQVVAEDVLSWRIRLTCREDTSINPRIKAGESVEVEVSHQVMKALMSSVRLCIAEHLGRKGSGDGVIPAPVGGAPPTC